MTPTPTSDFILVNQVLTRGIAAAAGDSRSLAVCIDMDGTYTDVRGIRHYVEKEPKDFTAFHGAALFCPPNDLAIEFGRAAHNRHLAVLVVTARMEEWRYQTRQWLNWTLDHPYVGPFMRAQGDMRKDVDVKREIFAEIEKKYKVVAACDDNPAIIELERELGIETVIVPGWDHDFGKS